MPVIRWLRGGGGRSSGGGCGLGGRPDRQAGQGPGAQGREEIDPVGTGRKLLFTEGVMGGAGNGGRAGLTSSAQLAARRRAPVLATPDGPAKAEVRLILAGDGTGWPTLVNSLVRLTKGAMHGVDFNKGRTWVGASAGFYPLAAV